MYDVLVKLAHENEPEIAKAAARLIKDAEIPFYSALPVEELAKRVLPDFNLRLRYLETGDLTEWKQYVENLTKERDKQGVNFTNIIKAGDCIKNAILQFFQKETAKVTKIDGISSDIVMRNIERRMQGLTMVGETTALKTGITINNARKQK